MNRADLDQLLVDLEREPLMRGELRSRARGCEKKRESRNVERLISPILPLR
jgi:hypothetical protein